MIYEDHISEITSSSAHSTILLEGAALRCKRFDSVLSVNDEVDVLIESLTSNEWEVVRCKYLGSHQLQRLTVYSSSNNNSSVEIRGKP